MKTLGNHLASRRRYLVTATSAYGTADYVVIVGKSQTIREAFERQFPLPLIGGNDRRITNIQPYNPCEEC